MHTVCVHAGDSLPWALVTRRDDAQERLVLCPLMRAQEDGVGAITNFIGPNNDFYLRCDYFRLDKPCVIMAASDGAFDFFPTTIHFEQFLMYRLMQSNDLEDCAGRLKQYYFDVNTNDDSSTIAFKAFGFDDYAQIQRLANRRQLELAEKYALDDEALYSQETGPNYALDSARSALRGQLAQFMDALWEESPSLRAMAVTAAQENNATRMKQIEEECVEALTRQRKAQKHATQDLATAIRRSWLAIRVSRGMRSRIKMPFLMGLLSGKVSIQEEYRRRDAHRKALVSLSDELQSGLSLWYDDTAAMGMTLSATDRRILERANACYGMYTDHIRAIRDMMDRYNDLMNTLVRDEARISDIADAILREEAGKIEPICPCAAPGRRTRCSNPAHRGSRPWSGSRRDRYSCACIFRFRRTSRGTARRVASPSAQARGAIAPSDWRARRSARASPSPKAQERESPARPQLSFQGRPRRTADRNRDSSRSASD